MKLLSKTSLLVASALGLCCSQALATELLVNGNFETGTLAGWTPTVLAGSSGNVQVDVPGSPTPISGHATVGTAANGNFYAVTDQTGPGTYSLAQAFTVGAGQSVNFSFDMFANDWDSGPIVNAAGLTHTAGANQHARVDLLTGSAGAFSTTTGLLANFFIGVDAGVDPHGFTHYSFDISSLVAAGGTFQIRFAEVDNQSFFNMGVDNVSVATAPDSGSSIALLGLAVLGAAAVRRRFAA